MHDGWLSRAPLLVFLVGLVLLTTAADRATEPAPMVRAAQAGESEARPTPRPEDLMRDAEDQLQNPDAAREVDPPLPDIWSNPEDAPAGLQIDPEVVGLDPALRRPQLRREGDFIAARRGRLVRSKLTDNYLFFFEPKQGELQPYPMILQPCGMLESMEKLIFERGSDVAFELSGRVYTYRGNNYLLTTQMKIHMPSAPAGDAPASP